MNTWEISIFIITILLSTVLFLENSHAVKFDRNECLAKIPKNATSVTANQMRKDCTRGKIAIAMDEHLKKEKENPNSPFLDHSKDFNSRTGTKDCANNYDTYLKKGVSATRKKMYDDWINDSLSFQENTMFKRKLTDYEKKEYSDFLKTADYAPVVNDRKHIEFCLKLFAQIGDPRKASNFKRVEDFITADALKDMNPSKKAGSVNTDDLAALAKRLDKLENENKKLKEQINQNKKK